MRKLLWSPQALRDLEGERLSAFPESGRMVPERNDPSIREVIVKPYRVVYRLKPGLVEIATVFRASRMFPESE